jgi:hypothetical protein
MKDYRHCCGNWRFVKKHNDLILCSSCIRKIRMGKERSIAEIKDIHLRFDTVINN